MKAENAFFMLAAPRMRLLRVAWRIADALELDRRSVALARIGLGLLVLLDVGEHVPLLRDFYTDEGFVSRWDAVGLWQRLVPNTPNPWSLHLLSGAPLWQWILFGLQAVCGLCLVAGYRTRIACIGAYVLLLSLCQRDVLLSGGDEWALVAFLFWAMFMRLDGALRFEPMLQRRGGRATFADSGTRASLASLGERAFTAQLVMMLFFAGLQKIWSSPAWRSGKAVYVLLQDPVVTTRLGRFLGERPAFVSIVLSYFTLVGELAMPWLLVTAVSARVRLGAVAWTVTALVGFSATLHVGRLPWVVIAALFAHVPGAVWDGIGWKRPRNRVSSFASAPWTEKEWVRGRIFAAALGVVLVHAIAVNVSRLGKDAAEPAWLENLGGFVLPRQGWGMFREVGGRSPWLVVAGTKRDAQATTVRIPDGRAVEFGPDDDVKRLQGNMRWTYFWTRFALLADEYPWILQQYLQRTCATWHSSTPLQYVEITALRGADADLERKTIAARVCDE